MEIIMLCIDLYRAENQERKTIWAIDAHLENRSYHYFSHLVKTKEGSWLPVLIDFPSSKEAHERTERSIVRRKGFEVVSRREIRFSDNLTLSETDSYHRLDSFAPMMQAVYSMRRDAAERFLQRLFKNDSPERKESPFPSSKLPNWGMF